MTMTIEFTNSAGAYIQIKQHQDKYIVYTKDDKVTFNILINAIAYSHDYMMGKEYNYIVNNGEKIFAYDNIKHQDLPLF